MNLVILTLLVAVAFFQGSNGQALYAGVLDFVNCTSISGNVCSSNATECKSVFICIPSMVNPIKASCSTGKTCNAGVCSSIASPLCEYGPRTFRCNTQGMYPEPSSCKQFNYCVPSADDPDILTLTQMNCDNGWAYNAMSNSCDRRLLNNNCAANDRVVPRCKAPGQNGALRTNPTMYYICMPYDDVDLELYPNIYKCPGNKRYAGNYLCR